jgi:hypothetical protein
MAQTKITLLWLVLAAQAIVCFVIWRSVQNAHLTKGIEVAWFLAAIAAGFILTAFSDARKRAILGGVIAAALAANIANISIDVARDPTSHNLFPFELAMTAVINLIGVAIGVGAGWPFRPKPRAM